MNSWDRFEVPFPFSRAIFHYGEPFSIPRELTEQDRERWRLELESRLNQVTAEAEARFDELYESGVK